MSESTMKLRSRVRNGLASALLLFAIASYGVLLYVGHEASKRVNTQTKFVQRLGSAASSKDGAKVDAAGGTLLLNPHPDRTASADWRFHAVSKNVAPGSSVRLEHVFVIGLGIALYRPNAYASIAVDGRTIGKLFPRVSKSENHPPFVVRDAPLEGIDVPPQYTTGLRFPASASEACVLEDCDVHIEVSQANWRIERVGLLFSSRPPDRPRLWARPLNAGAVGASAAALAGISHIVLSIRRQPPKTLKRTEPGES